MRACEIDAVAPFSFRESRWYLDRNFDDCMHRVQNDSVSRAINTPAGPAIIALTESTRGVRVELLSGSDESLAYACSFAEEWLDLKRGLRQFYRLLNADDRFAHLAKKYRGFHMVAIPDLFECLIWCVAGQQISLAVAYTLKRRLVEAYGEPLHHGGSTYYLFPAPETLSRCSVEDLRKLQFTTRKCEYIIGLAKNFMSGEISREALLSMNDEDRMAEYLMQFRGIGSWTANYALMKSLRAMNRIPYGDAGVNQALAIHAGLKSFDKKAIDSVFRSFEGWKTYLVYYLWRSRREMA